MRVWSQDRPVWAHHTTLNASRMAKFLLGRVKSVLFVSVTEIWEGPIRHCILCRHNRGSVVIIVNPLAFPAN